MLNQYILEKILQRQNVKLTSEWVDKHFTRP